MDRDPDDSITHNSSSFKESENDKSLVGKFKSHVSDIISNTPLSKWFRKPSDSSPVVRRRNDDYDDEISDIQPPLKRAKLPNNNQDYGHHSLQQTLSPIVNSVSGVTNSNNNFPEPVAGPSGIKSLRLNSTSKSVTSARKTFRSSGIVNGHKDSDSEESTSGYSSVARVGSKEQVCESQQTSKQASPSDSSPNKSRSLFQDASTTTTNPRSLFNERSISPNMNSSLSSRRPSFNATTFGSPNFVDRTISTQRIVNSPFYSGRTTYGGAAAYGKNLGRTQQDLRSSLRNSVQIQPVNKSSTEGNFQLGKTAKRILDTLEQYSTPVQDAKKIPIPSKKSKTDGMLTKYIGANPYIVRESKVPSNKELNVPSVVDLLKMKQNQQKTRLQDSTEAVRQIATKASLNVEEDYKIRTSEKEKEKHTGKMKTKITSLRQKPQNEEAINTLKLNPVALPITTMPKFDFKIPEPEKPKTPVRDNRTPPPPEKQNEEPPAKRPLIVDPPFKSAEPVKPIVEPQIASEFKFSEPIVLGENMKSIVGVNSFKFSEPIRINGKNEISVNFKMPENKVPLLLPKNNGETTMVKPAAVLKTGSVMDVLGKKDEKKDNSNVKDTAPSLMEKFKPAEGTWECSICMIRNQSDKTKCAACETPRKETKTNVSTPISSGFGDKFKQSGSTWECGTCLIRNKEELSKCAACETPRPGQKAPTISSGFGMRFAPPSNTWECKSCLVRNQIEKTSCVACETPKENVSKPASLNASGFGNILKRKEGDWECEVCLVKNKPADMKCQCCEAGKPGAQSLTTTMPNQEEKKSSTTFCFGIDKSAASSFSFGIPATMQSAITSKSGTNASSVFGEAAKSSATPSTPPKFTFGVTPASKPENSQSQPSKAAKTTKTDSAKPVNPLLKPNEKLPEKAVSATPNFSFGVPTTSSSAQKTVEQKEKKPESTITVSSTSGTEQPTFNFKSPAANGDINKSTFVFGAAKSESPGKTTFSVPASTGMFTLTPKTNTETKKTDSTKPEESAKPMFKFGSSSDSVAPKFGGNNSTTPPKFGTSSDTFQKLAPTTESTTPKFGLSTSTAPPAFGSTAPKFGTTITSTPPTFGANKNITTPVFGAAKDSTAPKFGTGTNTTPVFGTSVDSTSQKFGVSNTTAPPPFGAVTENKALGAASAFGTGANADSTTFKFTAKFEAAPSTNNPFGGSSNVMGGFGGNPSAPTAPSFGSGGTSGNEVKPFKFGSGSSSASEPPAKAPMFSFGQPTVPASLQAPSTGGFSFGASGNPSQAPAASFSFVKPDSATAQPPAAAIQAAPQSTFNAPSTGSMFGAAAPQQPASGGFNFGSAVANAVPNAQKVGFNFGSTAATNNNMQAGFNFGASSAAPSSGGFNFGAQPPAFDANAKPSFNFTGGASVAAFSAPPPSDGISTQRKIKRAVRRTQR